MDAPGFMDRFGPRLVVNGYPIIPIQPGTKKPGCHRGGGWRDYPDWTRHAARATTELELELWRGWPGAGIGIVGGAVAAVDIDIADDAELALRIERLARDLLGDTPALRIGRAPKRLLVYRTIAPFKGIKRHPLEILSLGQQFVAYAIHPATGRPYEWPQEGLADLDLRNLPSIDEVQARVFLDAAVELLPPSMLAPQLTKMSSKGKQSVHAQQGTLDAVRAALDYIPNPDLDYDSWVRIGMAIKGAVGEGGAELFARWSAQAAKNDPAVTAKSWADFKPTSIGAGTIYHLAMERGWKPDATLKLNGGAPRDAVHPAAGLLAKLKVEPNDRLPIVVPPEVYQVDGALELLVQYILGSAIRPQPWLAIGAALAALGTLMGHRYRMPTNLRSNLYVVCMASSGGGKDHARNCIKQAFLAAGLSRYLGGNKIASGAGLLSALYRQPASLFQIDEFGKFLEQIIDKRRAPKHLSEIWDLFTELATSAGSTFLGAEYADQKERPRQDIIEPCCSVHATTVPQPMWAALRHGSLHDGSLARFLVFRSPNDIPDRNPNPLPVSDVPAKLIAALQAIPEGVPGHNAGNLANVAAPNVKHDAFIVPLTDEAQELFRALDLDITRRQREAIGTGRDALLARVWENTAKLALIKAVSANPVAPLVRLEDAQWARGTVAHCLDTMFDQVERHIADNDTERDHKRVLEIIRQEGRQGIRKTQLYGRTRFLSRRDREDILTTLIESEYVVLDVRTTATKPVVFYRAREAG